MRCSCHGCCAPRNLVPPAPHLLRQPPTNQLPAPPTIVGPQFPTPLPDMPLPPGARPVPPGTPLPPGWGIAPGPGYPPLPPPPGTVYPGEQIIAYEPDGCILVRPSVGSGTRPNWFRRCPPEPDVVRPKPKPPAPPAPPDPPKPKPFPKGPPSWMKPPPGFPGRPGLIGGIVHLPVDCSKEYTELQNRLGTLADAVDRLYQDLQDAFTAIKAGMAASNQPGHACPACAAALNRLLGEGGHLLDFVLEVADDVNALRKSLESCIKVVPGEHPGPFPPAPPWEDQPTPEPVTQLDCDCLKKKADTIRRGLSRAEQRLARYARMLEELARKVQATLSSPDCVGCVGATNPYRPGGVARRKPKQLRGDVEGQQGPG